MDATRLRDGKRVMLKKVIPEEGPYELQISRMFSEVATNPRNHCVPLLDVINLPNSSQRLMVTPFLRPFDNPRFQTFGEFVAFFTQICEVCSRFFSDWDWPWSVLIGCQSGPPIHARAKYCTQVRVDSFESRQPGSIS